MTSKQRAFLRSMASKTPAVMQIGKSGLTETVLTSFDSALEARELLKLHVLENSGEDPKEILSVLCEKLGAEPVATVGRKIVFYRRAKEKPVIELP